MTTQERPLSIPSSTYRFQFHKEFPIKNALDQNLAEYLKHLGAAYCYSSPLLMARNGSTHGYDVVDHTLLNPEIATNDQFVEFSKQLKKHGLGLLLDIVPNHIGISSPHSRWWMDVLEHGKGSIFCDHFDINWASQNDRLVVPFLGNPIGTILQNGELKVAWNEVDQVAHAENRPAGAFQLYYYQTGYPVDPATLAKAVLEPALGSLPSGSATKAKLQGLIDKTKSLPERNSVGALTESDAQKRKERRATANSIKKEISALMKDDKDFQNAINHALGVLNQKGSQQLTDFVQSQPYRLCYWKIANDELNYRRFFDINELLAIKTENREVLEESLQLVGKWIQDGHVDALRLDHPDGLYNPAAYFDQLQEHIKKVLPANFKSADKDPKKPLYVLVEKILEPGEALRKEWPVSGTVGYEFLNLINDVFVDTSKAEAARKNYLHFVEGTPAARMASNFADLLYDSKKLMLATSMETELQSLANILHAISRHSLHTSDFSSKQLKSALAELVACFPVYRSYITQTVNPNAEDIRFIQAALKGVRDRGLADELIVDLFETLLLCKDEDKLSAEQKHQRRHFVMKLQQLTGPVMAKGLEDTSFYRFFLLTSLNEVGGDPDHFGVPLEEFHKANSLRAKDWPQALSGSSTHDTKRSEDVRARINVLSEIPEAWIKVVEDWRKHNSKYKQEVPKIGLVPEPNEEYMIYQTLLGVWPLGSTSCSAEVLDRIKNYLNKSMKEAKLHTTWTKQNKPYEDAMLQFVEKVVKDAEFVKQFLQFSEPVFKLGKLNSLSQTVIKITAPGVPDIYQGQELWDFSLVDPDNRRPVDYSVRKSLLARVKAVSTNDSPAFAATALRDEDNSGLIKLFVTERLLNLRNQHVELFLNGDYRSVPVSGSRANDVVAFERSFGDQHIVTIAARFFSHGTTWQDEKVQLSGKRYRNVFTAQIYESGSLELKTLFQHVPFAVLEAIKQ